MFIVKIGEYFHGPFNSYESAHRWAKFVLEEGQECQIAMLKDPMDKLNWETT